MKNKQLKKQMIILYIIFKKYNINKEINTSDFVDVNSVFIAKIVEHVVRGDRGWSWPSQTSSQIVIAVN